MADIDLSTLTLVPSVEAQDIQSAINVLPQWFLPRGVNSLEGVEQIYSVFHGPHQPWSAGAAVWVLVPRDNPTTTDILASCDTYARTGVVRTPSGEQREVTTYLVSAVFTPKEHRGKGYGKHMLRLLHYVLAPDGTLPSFPTEWGAPPPKRLGDAAFSMLFSEIGDTFYANATKGLTQPGWVAGWDRAPARKWLLKDVKEELKDGWEWLDDKSVIPLEGMASAWMRREVAKVGDAYRTRVFCPPEEGRFRFHWTRERLFSEAADIVPAPRVLGVKLGPEDDAPFFTFTVYDYIHLPRRLVIDFVLKPDEIPWEAVRAAVAKVGASDVRLWGGYAGWDSNDQGEKPEVKFGTLTPCLAQYGLVDKDEDIEWLWCEFYLFG